jgi:hypothetical protein
MGYEITVNPIRISHYDAIACEKKCSNKGLAIEKQFIAFAEIFF